MDKMHTQNVFSTKLNARITEKYLLLLPLVSLIRVLHPNTKMVDNLFLKINSEFIPKWFERISFLRL